MQTPDPMFLDRLPRREAMEVVQLAIELQSRSVAGIGPVWDLLRTWHFFVLDANTLLRLFADNPGWIVWPALAVVGSVLASYADQLGWRLARLEDAEDFGLPLSSQELALIRSRRSRCPPCGRRIRVRDNIPVLSWLLLKGRCRCKAARIPRRHLAAELTGAALLPFLFWAFGPSIAFLAIAFYATVAGAASLADMDRRILPNRLNYAILWVGLLLAALSPVNRGPDAYAHWLRPVTEVPLAPAVFAVIGTWLFLFFFNKFLMFFYKRDDSLGWGDVKFLIALAAWVGPAGLVLSVVFAGASALVYTVAVRRREFPAGPHLALGGLAAMLPFVQAWTTEWYAEFHDFLIRAISPNI